MIVTHGRIAGLVECGVRSTGCDGVRYLDRVSSGYSHRDMRMPAGSGGRDWALLVPRSCSRIGKLMVRRQSARAWGKRKCQRISRPVVL